MPLHVSSKLDWANPDRLSCSRNARLGTPRSTRAMKVSRGLPIERTERRNRTKYEPVKERNSEVRLLGRTRRIRTLWTLVAQRPIISSTVFLAKLSTEFTPFRRAHAAPSLPHLLASLRW